MGYSAKALAQLSGITTRTLRFYEEKGLLTPGRMANGYRVYEAEEVDRLQAILFFKNVGMPLEKIQTLLANPFYDRGKALEGQLQRLEEALTVQQTLIATLKKTLKAMRHGEEMKDMEKFEGLKEKMLQENEERYGKEIRAKYAVQTIDAANAKFKGMSKDLFEKAQTLSQSINQSLLAAIRTNDPASDEAKETCELHKQWLCLYWPQGYYTRDAHIGLAQMYVDDERFKAYYDQIAPGAAEFLRSAIIAYCE